MQFAVRQALADGFQLSAVNYTTMANAHARYGNRAQVFEVLSLMRAAGVSPTNVTLRVAAKACEGWDVTHAAVEALLTMLRWSAERNVDEPDSRTWNLALRALARKGATQQMTTVLGWMKKGATDHLPGVADSVRENIPKPTVCSYNTCLHALGKQNKFHEAVQLFADMLVRNGQDDDQIQLDSVTYNTLLEMAVNTHRFIFPGDAQGIVNDRGFECDPSRFVQAITASMHRHSVQPNITTETLILRLLTRKNALPPHPNYVRSRMRLVFDDVEQTHYHPDKKYFDALITAFARATDMDGVSTSFEEMLSRNIRPDVHTLRALLVAASRCGDVDLAMKILDVSHKHGLNCDDHMYTTAIATCARATPRDPETADKLLQNALERGNSWSSSMVNAAISSYESDVSKAIELWKKLRNCADEASRCALRERCVYEALARVCGRSARPDLALRILYAAKSAKDLDVNSPESRAMFNAFMRGMKEADVKDAVRGNLLKGQYMQHLKVACGVSEEIRTPIERIRIKF